MCTCKAQLPGRFDSSSVRSLSSVARGYTSLLLLIFLLRAEVKLLRPAAGTHRVGPVLKCTYMQRRVAETYILETSWREIVGLLRGQLFFFLCFQVAYGVDTSLSEA